MAGCIKYISMWFSGSILFFWEGLIVNVTVSMIIIFSLFFLMYVQEWMRA